ncbi:MAG: hypothetical protein ACK2T6_00115, partial [Anaerolineae bacterium]
MSVAGDVDCAPPVGARRASGAAKVLARPTAALVLALIFGLTAAMLTSVTAWAWPGESPSGPVSSRSALSLDGLYAAGSLATDPRAAEGRSAEPRIGVAAVAEFTLREGPDQSVTDSFAYRLLRDQEVFAWPSGAGEGGLASGIGVIALPDLTKSRSAPRHSTQMMIANMVPEPGFTDFAIFIYDQNGLLDYVLEKL